MANHMRDSNSEPNQMLEVGFAIDVTLGRTQRRGGTAGGWATAPLKKPIFTVLEYHY
jgi:hypothetical protein